MFIFYDFKCPLYGILIKQASKMFVIIYYEIVLTGGNYMERYTKVFDLMGSYFTRKYEKKGKHKNKVREVKESTVKKFFLQGKAEVLVIMEETGKEILLDFNSDKDDIKKYLGKSFI